MPTLRQLLIGLSNEELEALKQEFMKAQETGGEIASEKGRGLLKANMPSRIGRGILAGIQGAGQSVVKDVRAMAGFEEPETVEWKPKTREEALAFEREKRGIAEEAIEELTPVYTVDPQTGELIESGVVKKGSKVYRGTPTFEEKLGYEKERASIIKQEQEKSQARNLLRDSSLIQQDVDELMGYLDKVPVGRVGGTIAELEKKWGTDSEAALGLRDYEDSLELFLGKIAKTFGGEVGVLTDRDIERIRKAFPKFWMTQEERKNRIKFIKDYIQRRVDMFTKKAGQQKVISEINTPFFNSEQEALASGIKGEVTINGRKARID